jgi:hypothetical protein
MTEWNIRTTLLNWYDCSMDPTGAASYARRIAVQAQRTVHDEREITPPRFGGLTGNHFAHPTFGRRNVSESEGTLFFSGLSAREGEVTMSDRIEPDRHSSNSKFTMISLLILGFLAGVALMVFLNSHI